MPQCYVKRFKASIAQSLIKTGTTNFAMAYFPGERPSYPMFFAR
jgi:hypothetical protein